KKFRARGREKGSCNILDTRPNSVKSTRVPTSGHAPINAFGLHVGSHARQPLFASDTAALETPKWRGNGSLLIGVDPHRTRSNRAGDSPGAPEVRRPDAGGKPVVSIVTLPQQVLLASEREHHGDRTKNLFSADVGRIVQAGQYRRGIVSSRVKHASARP